jgi:hypothetical protein
MFFRFTIGANNERVLCLREPGDLPFEGKLECLKNAKAAGFQTSTSAPTKELVVSNL